MRQRANFKISWIFIYDKNNKLPAKVAKKKDLAFINNSVFIDKSIKSMSNTLIQIT